uniref:Uncharacterized protein n=1 Tax=Myoviridae sp. ctTrm2 TaxID=2825114 RepID=A0A8S5UK13_9CAUD|nr:MAG TPA: hypothetical protein [Myoviridae sp. ctTrm2]DAY51505.1 MAG TPA: hypothetical protein [Caudoviricetes sp.]
MPKKYIPKKNQKLKDFFPFRCLIQEFSVYLSTV